MEPSKILDPIHPGEILLEEFMKPLSISIMGTYFSVSPETWLDLQLDYDLRLARQRNGEQINNRVRTRPAA